MKKKFLFALVTVIVVSTWLLSACAKAATPTPAPVVTTAAPTVAPTVAPTPTNTVAPTATLPTPACPLMANPPKVKEGDLGSATNPLVITFVPSGDTGAITVAGTAIADCLSSMTGLTFNIEVGTSFGASIEAMGGGKAQIGFLNTFSILLAEQKYGIVPVIANLRKYATNAVDPDKALAGKMEPFYKAEFLTTPDSGIKTLADLKGKTFCFVDPNSTSGYIVPRILMKAAGVDPDTDITAVNAGSHPNVAIGVYKGQCQAGVAYIDILTDASANLAATYPDIATKVVAFMDSDKIPNDGVQVVKDLNPEITAAVVNGLLAMEADTNGGAVILKKLYNINGMQKIDATFYNDFANILKKAGVDPATLVK